MSRLYVVLDVFADRAFAGNPLAVLLDAAGLDSAAMLAIAKEFNLSETVFLLPAEDEARKARLRIFTPQGELPFAGHPTVGTAALLGLMEAAAGKRGPFRFELEELVGVVPCEVETTGRRSARASFRLPKQPAALSPAPDSAALAAALGLSAQDIGFDGHVASRFDAGNAFTFAPLNSLDALGRARVEPGRWAEAVPDRGVFLYTRETGDPRLAFRARMLRSDASEDPATGSAVAAFAGAVMAFDRPADGSAALSIGQGFEMGRPSVIELGLTVENGALAEATIGGHAVVAAEGSLFDA